MARIESENFYIAERDENYKGESSAWVVSKDQEREFIFTNRGNFFVLTYNNLALEYFSYQEARDLVNSLL